MTRVLYTLLALGLVPMRAAAIDLEQAIEEAAKRHGVPAAIVHAVIAEESAGNPAAVSAKGAMGLMQLMPGTADRFGVLDPFDPSQSLDGGCAYLRWLLERFDGRVDLAVAAYNAGEATIDRFGGVPPFPETREYVRRVVGRVRATMTPRRQTMAPAPRPASRPVALAIREATASSMLRLAR